MEPLQKKKKNPLTNSFTNTKLTNPKHHFQKAQTHREKKRLVLGQQQQQEESRPFQKE